MLLSILLIVHIKWLLFGKLTPTEIERVRNKVGYTLWEFTIGFMIFYIKCFSFDMTLIRHELYKYAGLFLCVLLLKSFHYLSQERVLRVYENVNVKYVTTRFSIGLVLLNLIDGMLVFRFFYEIFSKYTVSFKDNILLSIFGFEILKVLPLIISTSLKFILNYCEHHNKMSVDTKDRYFNILDFLVNLIRFCMVCVFSIIFLYFHTFPFHILPSSYDTFRLLIDVTRSLIKKKRKRMVLKKLRVVKGTDERCVVCFEILEEDVREFGECRHMFHNDCLSSWFDYGWSCPTCRSPSGVSVK